MRLVVVIYWNRRLSVRHMLLGELILVVDTVGSGELGFHTHCVIIAGCAGTAAANTDMNNGKNGYILDEVK